MRALGFMTLAAFAIAGCALDQGANGNNRCASDGSCTTPGTHCDRGFCVQGGGIDGDVHPDSGIDAGVDAPMGDGGIDAGDGGNWCDGSMMPCTTGQPGACSAGHIVCSSMGGTCVRDHDPAPEVCGHPGGPDDEDCDGIIDEESSVRCYAGATVGCTQTGGVWTCVGACRTGTQACNTGGTLGACTGSVNPSPGLDTCQSGSATGFDDDCDGTIDDGCTCTTGTMRACFPGAPSQAGVGECHTGTQMCTGGMWGPCSGAGRPMPETCPNDLHDNDCDAHVDNIPGAGVACSIPAMMGDCGDGVIDCSGGALMCVAPGPAAAEACDHHDDDCDGLVDESFHLASDNMNCGGCGHACGMGTTCCNGVCVDESTDEMNCGACTTSCGTALGAQCCMAGATPSPMCLDTRTDPMNCGGCGNVCSSNQLCCGGACIDPLTNTANCHACGTACSGTNGACCGGVCHVATAPECTGCAVDCSMQVPPTSCCGNSCTNRMTDEMNCGTCGHVCGTGQFCCAGSCVASDTAHCGGACSVCGSGQLCCGTACVPNDTRHCQSCTASCATGNACCADGCRDLTADSNDCGSCGMSCTGGAHCTNSHCCAPGLTYCGAAGCVNTNSNGANCGSCGHNCVLGCNGSGGCNLF